ncbi:MAG: GDYXXLXY domain-containing protein [Desulfobacterales bacterium]|nr:GDYXXLXY domain-containing protein [Desulfobacterales bacterium]
MRWKFIFLVLLQAALLVGMIAYRQYWVATGERILLRTAPVDPRDIFRGDYLSLRYDISTLDLDGFGVKGNFKSNEKVYVILERNQEGVFSAVSVSRGLPSGKRFIQGRVQYETTLSKWEVTLKDDSENLHELKPQWFENTKRGDRITFCLDEKGNALHFYKEDADYRPKCRGQSLSGIIEGIREMKSRVLHVEYGIENYFVEEGKGRAIESSRNARELRVEVSLRKDGKGIITGLFVDEKLVR